MDCDGRCKHVMMVPTPFAGHCIPFFYLASRLAHLGVRVTLLVAEGLVPQFYSHSLFTPHVGLIQSEGVEVVKVKDGFSHLGFLAGLKPIFQESSEPVHVAGFGESVAALMARTDLPSPCCIVSDMLQGWTQTLAKQFNLPRFVLHTQSATNLSLMLHVPTLLAEGRLPLTDTNQDKPVEIPGLKVPLPTVELPFDLHPFAKVPNAYENFLRMSRRNGEAPIVLVNTFRELEPDVFAALEKLHEKGANGGTPKPKAIPVGPLLLSAAFAIHGDAFLEPELDDGIARFLAAQPQKSVLYIAFGSAVIMGTMKATPDQIIEELALGLEASGQPFLWIQGCNRTLSPDAPSLAQLLPPGFEERTKGRGLVVSEFVPQLRILHHPAIGAFLSHCGWNSCLEVSRRGSP